MAGAPRPYTPANEGLPDILGKLVDINVSPEHLLTKPNQRLAPGFSTFGQYEPQPGDMVDDAGRWWTADNQPIEFVQRPFMSEFLSALPTVGGIAGAEAKAGSTVLGAGPIIKARPSELMNMDPTVMDHVAGQVEASRKRAGYKLGGDETLQKADNAVMKMSGAPSKNAYGVVDRAAQTGNDTHMFHVTGLPGEGRVGSLTPWQVSDPHRAGRGAIFFGDRPSSIVKSGAAVGAGGGNGGHVHPFLLRGDIFGEHMMSPELMSRVPDQLKFESSSPTAWATQPSLQDVTEALKNGPYSKEAEAAWLADHSARKAAGAYTPSSEALSKQLADAYGAFAKRFVQVHYDPTTGGRLIPPEDFMGIPTDKMQPGAPHYTTYEDGAAASSNNMKYGYGTNTPPVPGVHSPMQTAMTGAGFTGARILDETNKVGGKTIAMHYMPGIRSVNAKFDPRKVDINNTLAGATPPGWFAQLFNQPTEERR